MKKNSKKSNGWTHPVHARGVRSPRLDVRGGKLLSDRRIDHYARLGYYGTEEQERVLAEDKKNKKKKGRGKKAPQLTLALALKALGIK